MAEDIEFLRQLIEEANALPPSNGGTTLADMALNDWSVWTKKPKSPQRRDDDRRAAYVLSRLNEKYPRAFTHEGIPEHIRNAAEMYRQDPSKWDSAYEDREGDYPIYHATKWAQSLPSAIYATGKMVGNEIDKAVYGALSSEGASKHVPYPEAYGDYEYAVNTLTGGLTDAAGILPKGRSYWHDQSGVTPQQERKPQIGFYPSSSRDAAVASAAHASMPQLEEGQQFLERAGAHPTVARYLGPAMDSAIGFPPSIGSAIGYARAGMPMRALSDLAVDYALSTPHITIPAAISAANKYREGKLPWEK